MRRTQDNGKATQTGGTRPTELARIVACAEHGPSVVVHVERNRAGVLSVEWDVRRDGRRTENKQVEHTKCQEGDKMRSTYDIRIQLLLSPPSLCSRRRRTRQAKATDWQSLAYVQTVDQSLEISGPALLVLSGYARPQPTDSTLLFCSRSLNSPLALFILSCELATVQIHATLEHPFSQPPALSPPCLPPSIASHDPNDKLPPWQLCRRPPQTVHFVLRRTVLGHLVQPSVCRLPSTTASVPSSLTTYPSAGSILSR